MSFNLVSPGKDLPNDFNVIIEISAQSDPKGGTRIMVRLPRRAGTPGDKASHPSPTSLAPYQEASI